MSAATTAAAGLPTPVESGELCRAAVGLENGAWQVYWARDGGRSREYVGPRFPRDAAGRRQAGALCNALNERSQS